MELRCIDFSLSQAVLEAYDKHCRELLDSKDAEIRKLRQALATVRENAIQRPPVSVDEATRFCEGILKVASNALKSD